MEAIGRSLTNLWVIAKQEFSLYFLSPIVYVAGAFWFALTAIFFNLSLSGFNQGFEPTMDYTFRPMSFLTILIAPALTAKLLADEIRAGTHELLLTAPVRDWEIVVGKWLGAWTIVTLFILLTIPFPLLMILRGNPDVGDIAAAYLGVWLLWGAVLALGLLTSSLTQYQFVAYIISFGILIFLWIASGISQLVSELFISAPGVVTFVNELTLTNHLQNGFVNRGLINALDVAYFVGLMMVSLFFATQLLGARRWRA